MICSQLACSYESEDFGAGVLIERFEVIIEAA